MYNFKSHYQAVAYFRSVFAAHCSFLVGNVINGYVPNYDAAQLLLPTYYTKDLCLLNGAKYV